MSEGFLLKELRLWTASLLSPPSLRETQSCSPAAVGHLISFRLTGEGLWRSETRIQSFWREMGSSTRLCQGQNQSWCREMSHAEDNAPGEWCAHCLCWEKRQSLRAKGWEGKEGKAMRAKLNIEERPFLQSWALWDSKYRGRVLCRRIGGAGTSAFHGLQSLKSDVYC